MSKYDAAYQTCPICAAGNIRQYHADFRGNRIFICPECTVQFMNPVYSDGYLSDYYAGYYGGGLSDKEVAEGQRRNNKMKFRFIDKFTQPPGKVLDFGCGNGNFTNFSKEKGWDVLGYDVDCEAMKKVESGIGVPIKCGHFPDVDWKDKRFDLIHAHHVVEHLKHPVRDLKILHKLLADDGYLYIGVPNIHAWSARVKLFLEKIGLKRSRIGKYYDSDHHVFYYTPQSMKVLLDICGFEVILCKNGDKAHMSESRWVQVLMYDLLNYFYSNAAFFVIAQKKCNVN